MSLTTTMRISNIQAKYKLREPVKLRGKNEREIITYEKKMLDKKKWYV